MYSIYELYKYSYPFLQNNFQIVGIDCHFYDDIIQKLRIEQEIKNNGMDIEQYRVISRCRFFI